MNTQSQYGYSYLKPTLYYNNSNINIDNNLYLYQNFVYKLLQENIDYKIGVLAALNNHRW